MGISCRMILSLPYANQLQLLAGESGLSNKVQWVHYLEEPSYAQWLRGGELIILTGLVTGNDGKQLGRLVELLFEKQAAGVVVSLSEFIPQVPEEVCRLCDRLGLPLFQVPAQVRILDISQSICFAIFQRRRRADQAEALLQDLLTGKRLSEKRVQSLKRLGFDGTRKYRAAVFQVEVTNPPAPTADPEGMVFYEEESREELGQMAARVLGDLLLPENRELLETLDCYVRCNCSAKKAAEPLFLHVNTLHYRLKKIEAILGRDLSQAEDLFDVMLALKLHWFQEQEIGFEPQI